MATGGESIEGGLETSGSSPLDVGVADGLKAQEIVCVPFPGAYHRSAHTEEGGAAAAVTDRFHSAGRPNRASYPSLSESNSSPMAFTHSAAPSGGDGAVAELRGDSRSEHARYRHDQRATLPAGARLMRIVDVVHDNSDLPPAAASSVGGGGGIVVVNGAGGTTDEDDYSDLEDFGANSWRPEDNTGETRRTAASQVSSVGELPSGVVGAAAAPGPSTHSRPKRNPPHEETWWNRPGPSGPREPRPEGAWGRSPSADRVSPRRGEGRGSRARLAAGTTQRSAWIKVNYTPDLVCHSPEEGQGERNRGNATGMWCRHPLPSLAGPVRSCGSCQHAHLLQLEEEREQEQASRRVCKKGGKKMSLKKRVKAAGSELFQSVKKRLSRSSSSPGQVSPRSSSRTGWVSRDVEKWVQDGHDLDLSLTASVLSSPGGSQYFLPGEDGANRPASLHPGSSMGHFEDQAFVCPLHSGAPADPSQESQLTYQSANSSRTHGSYVRSSSPSASTPGPVHTPRRRHMAALSETPMAGFTAGSLPPSEELSGEVEGRGEAGEPIRVIMRRFRDRGRLRAENNTRLPHLPDEHLAGRSDVTAQPGHLTAAPGNALHDTRPPHGGALGFYPAFPAARQASSPRVVEQIIWYPPRHISGGTGAEPDRTLHHRGGGVRVHTTTVDYMHCLVPDMAEVSASCYYWGQMNRYEAERLLEGRPEGTFLLRDSAQDNFLFSVSFNRYGRSLHARIEQWGHRFSFDSCDSTVFRADTILGLLKRYSQPGQCMFFEPMLTAPLKRTFPFSLRHLSRVAVTSRVSYDGIEQLPLPAAVKSYLRYYHYKHQIRVHTAGEVPPPIPPTGGAAAASGPSVV